MDIVFFMAGGTFAAQLDHIGRLQVAGFALCLRMLTGEHECCHRVMIEVDRVPCLLIVAAPAILPVPASVIVVGRMATKACNWGAGDLRFLLVARVAICPPMRSAEGELGQMGVIETDLGPRARIVASSAVLPATTLVTVIRLVT
jgi:hypothetical protein